MNKLPAGIFRQSNGKLCSKFWYGSGHVYNCIRDADHIEEAVLSLHIQVSVFSKDNPEHEIFFDQNHEILIAKRNVKSIQAGRRYIDKIRITKQEIHYLDNHKKIQKA